MYSHALRRALSNSSLRSWGNLFILPLPSPFHYISSSKCRDSVSIWCRVTMAATPIPFLGHNRASTLPCSTLIRTRYGPWIDKPELKPQHPSAQSESNEQGPVMNCVPLAPSAVEVDAGATTVDNVVAEVLPPT